MYEIRASTSKIMPRISQRVFRVTDKVKCTRVHDKIRNGKWEWIRLTRA